jgi:diguanylate cyclase (GGDEF)-like protein/PAS domain S-box-containing protein
MDALRFEETRYRTRLFALVLSAVLSAAGAYNVYVLPRRLDIEWWLLVAYAVLCLVLIPLLLRMHARGEIRRGEQIGVVIVVAGSLALLQRVAFAYHGSILDDPEVTTFRPVNAFVPFVYIAALAMLRSELALRLCWAYWLVQCVVVLSGLANLPAEHQARDTIGLLLWLLVGNPLLILLMHALPRYEHWLERSRKELEEMRERAQLSGRLAESEHRFNLVVESLQAGVWDQVRGAGKTQHWWSPRFYELLGYTPEELPASTANIRSLTHPDDGDQLIREMVAQLRSQGRATRDARLRTRSEGYRWFNISARAEKNDRGEIVHVAGSMVDIHDRRSAEEALLAAKEEMRKLAYRDALTGLANRRAFDEILERELRRAQRENAALSLLLVDVDYFKPFNDRYGHIAGDECLRQVAEQLGAYLQRPGDVAARLGGDEFAVLLAGTSAEGALHVAQAIHRGVESLAVCHEGSPLRRMSVSIGVATQTQVTSATLVTANALLSRADAALYEVKGRGRNGVLHESAAGQVNRG